MKKLIGAIVTWAVAYLVAFVFFIVIASIAATFYRQGTFGSSAALAYITLATKLSGVALPAVVLGRKYGRTLGVLVAVSLTVVSFLAAQILPGALFIFAMFLGDEYFLLLVYVLIAVICAALAGSRSKETRPTP